MIDTRQGEPDPVAEAIQAVSAAVNRAAFTIEAHADPDEAFDYTTLLWEVLRTAMATNGQLRARIAYRIRVTHRLDLRRLAERLSRPGHSIGTARAGQLVQAGRPTPDPPKEDQ